MDLRLKNLSIYIISFDIVISKLDVRSLIGDKVLLEGSVDNLGIFDLNITD